MLWKLRLALMSIGVICCSVSQAGAQNPKRELAAIVEANDRYFRALRSWEGVGNLKEVFTVDRKTLSVPDLKPEPVRIERLSKIRFAWDVSLNSVRAISSCVPPTKLFQTGSEKEKEIVEKLQINCLIRPDGFYRFEPNLAFSDFEGYPQFGKMTRVLEKRSRGDADKERTYSYLFDPQTVFEIHGQRIDSHLKLLQEKMDKGIVSIEPGSNFKVIERYKNTTGPEFRLETVLDRAKGYLPVRCSGFMDDTVVETSEWVYGNVEGVILPTTRDVKKFHNGVFISSRSISISESKVNKKFTENDFSFASLGVKDDDRLIDREAKKIYVLENGKQNEITAKTPGVSFRLIAGNVLAVVFLVVAFRSCAKKV